MSYCRFGDADIYVFPSSRGFECSGCPTTLSFTTTHAAVMIQHMQMHERAGLDVPEYAYWGVWEDRHMYRIPAQRAAEIRLLSGGGRP